MSAMSIHKQLLENLSTAILLIDENLVVRYMNPAAEILFLVSGNRTHGHPISEVVLGSTEFLIKLDNAAKTGVGYTQREETLTLLNDRTLIADYMVNPFYSSVDDRSLIILEVLRRDRLVRINRDEDFIAVQETTRNLLSGLAHEVKNPLGGIRGAAQLLSRELPNESLEEYTTVIIEEADRLRNLVDRMLGPRKRLNHVDTNIHEVIERVCSLIRVETQGRISLIRDYDPSIPDFKADAEQLIQTVLNIVRNAMQAIESQDPPNPYGRITLRTRIVRQFTIGLVRHRLVAQIDIEDNGPGIPEEISKFLFLPMVSGNTNNGSGLGLSIAQSIINAHRGIIECQSVPGCTVFTLYLPLELNHG